MKEDFIYIVDSTRLVSGQQLESRLHKLSFETESACNHFFSNKPIRFLHHNSIVKSDNGKGNFTIKIWNIPDGLGLFP